MIIESYAVLQRRLKVKISEQQRIKVGRVEQGEYTVVLLTYCIAKADPELCCMV